MPREFQSGPDYFRRKWLALQGKYGKMPNTKSNGALLFKDKIDLMLEFIRWRNEKKDTTHK